MSEKTKNSLSVQGWASAAALLLAVAGVSKALGFLRELLLASYFGASGQVDAYALAYAIPLFLAGGAGYAFSTTIIPGYHQELVAEGRAAGIRFLTVTCLSSIIWSIVLLLPMWVMPAFAIKVAAPSLPDSTVRLAVHLMGWVALYVLMLNIVYVLSAVFHALNHFWMPAASDLLFNIVSIGMFLALASTWGIQALVMGNLVGIALCCVVLIVVLVRTTPVLGGLNLRRADILKPMMASLPVAAYYVCSQFAGVLANYFAAALGEGNIAAFSYARTLLAAVVTLVTLNVARGAFPTLAILSSEHRIDELRAMVLGLARLVVFIFVPVSALAFMYREPLLALLYQRGAFDDTALHLTATAFGFLALGLIFAAFEPLITRALYAVGDIRAPLIATASSACLVVFLLMFLTPTLGLGGVSLSLSLAFAADIVLQIVYLGRRLESPIWSEVGAFLLGCTACALLASVIFLVVPSSHVAGVIGGMLLYAGLYVFLVWFAKQVPMRLLFSVATGR